MKDVVKIKSNFLKSANKNIVRTFGFIKRESNFTSK